jgi:DNA repair protein RadC
MEEIRETRAINTWSINERPREKLIQNGKKALSDAELIAILLGSGTKKLNAVDLAKEILLKCEQNLNNLAQLEFNQLIKFQGIGPAKAISIISALELGRRRKASKQPDRPKIQTSNDVYEIVSPHLMDLKHEEFYVLLLNRANQVLKLHHVSKGGISGTVADPKIIFAEGLSYSASAIILVHNHPSGNLRPSQADIDLTRKMIEGGIMLDLPILDHLIYSNTGYFSFADEGMMTYE